MPTLQPLPPPSIFSGAGLTLSWLPVPGAAGYALSSRQFRILDQQFGGPGYGGGVQSSLGANTTRYSFSSRGVGTHA